MHDKCGAIMIDSKKTWKLMQKMDKDLKKIPYKDVKNMMYMLGDDFEDSPTFLPASTFGRRYIQNGTIIIHMATKKD